MNAKPHFLICISWVPASYHNRLGSEESLVLLTYSIEQIEQSLGTISCVYIEEFTPQPCKPINRIAYRAYTVDGVNTVRSTEFYRWELRAQLIL